jgi:hypothetical protein
VAAERPFVAALGRAIVAYPFLVATLVVAVALEASDRGHRHELLGWLLWAVLWVGIAAMIAGFFVVPILSIEFWVWAWVVRRVPALERSWPGVVMSVAVLAAPWALAPRRPGWMGPVLIFIGLLAARIAVPSLRPGAFLSE